MATEERTYCPISRQAFQAIRADLAKEKINLPDENTGTTSAPFGFTVKWNYVEVDPKVGQNYLQVFLTGDMFMDTALKKLDARIKPYEGK